MIDQKAFEWLNENQLSYDIWDKKYRYNQESFDSWLDRVSGSNEKIKQLIYDKKFIFGGRILANRGLDKFDVKTTLSNCYVITPPEDSIESIFDAGKKLARTFSYGGGCIEENTKIIVKDKGRIPIKDVKIGDYVLSFNIKTHKDEWKKVTNWQYTNVKLQDQIEYVYSNGVRLKTSKLHPILNIGSDYEYKVYQDLKSEIHNNKTPNHKKLNYIPQSDIDDIAWFIGCHMGDGTADYKKIPRIRINGDNYNVINKFTKVINRINNSNITPRLDKSYKNTSVWGTSSNHTNNKYIFSNYFDNQINSKTYTWKIPNYIKDHNLYIPFLAGLIDSDGYINDRGHIDISICSKQAIEEICSYLSECGQGYHVNVKYPNRKNEKPLYRIYIYTNTDVYKLIYNYIQHDGKKKIMQHFLDKNSIKQKHYYKLINSEVEYILNYNYKPFYNECKQLYYKLKQDQFNIKNTNKIGSKPLYSYYKNNIFNNEQYAEIKSRVHCVNIIEDNFVKYKYIDITVEGNQNYYAGEFGFVNIHNCGLDISNLRPKGSIVNNAAKTTSGAVSFMDLYSHITGLIGQSGRRGALMLSIDCTHPDIIDFINLKTNLEVCTKANISIKMFDEFFQAIENNQDFYLYWNEEHTKLNQKQLNEHFNTLNYNELIFSNKYNSYIKKVNPKEILMLLAQRNWEMGEPGILYWDTISNYNILSNTDFQYAGVNPCAEEPLPAGGSCLLGSINLAEFVNHPFLEDANFDYISFNHTIHQAINGLNEVLIEGLELHPLQEQRDSVRDWRQIGLGITGLGDALIKLGITYGSNKAIEFTKHLSICLAKESIRQSVYLAKIDSCYPKCEKEKICDSTFIQNLNLDEDLKNDINKYGLYNSQLLTCAPTGSISTMLQVSSGCEPNYAFKYIRKTQSLNNKDVYYEVNASILDDYLKIYPNAKLPDYFISSNDLNYQDRIKMQEALQIGIDASISSTLNVKEQTTIEDIYKIYYNGWKHHLKGCTIWRDNCYRAGVLSKDAPKEITQTSAPKRPKKLSAHYYPVKVKGEQFIIMIGLLDSKPYEIFAFKDTTGFKCKDHEGVLIKKAKGHYTYESDCCSIDKIEVEAIEARTSIYLSMLLRHGVDIKQIIKTAKKVNPGITSFTSAIVRVLSKYTEAEVTSELCPECGEKLIRESGCISCKSCGYSKCG